MVGPPGPILEIGKLHKSFRGTQVLKSIDLEIQQGEFLVLVGPSGCGKSTLLNCIAGLEEPTSGRIAIAGRDMAGVPPKDRGIAMVFQSYALYPTMTVAKNITFGMKVRGASRAEQQSALEQVSRTLRIEHLLDRRPAQLSGGQRQRVAMGRALVRQPKLFLLDEPLSNLDAKLRVEMRAEIKRLHNTLGATIIHVTHDQTEAMSLATQVAVMEEGNVVQIGPPQEVYDFPVNVFVAGFIGSPAMNFIDARLQKKGDSTGLDITVDEQTHRLPVDHYAFRDTAKDGLDVILGVRPEYITGVEGGDGSENSVEFDLPASMTETSGYDQHVKLLLGKEEIEGRFSPRERISLGEPVRTRIDLSRISIFDRESGKRI